MFDETVHGYGAKPPNPFLLLFRFPFVVATVQGLIAVALLLWATLARFGAPQSAPPPLSAGRGGLLAEHGQADRALRPSAGDGRPLRSGNRPRRCPPAACAARAGGEGLLAWLRRVGDARGVEVDCGGLMQGAARAGAARRRRTARSFAWRAILTDGSGRFWMDVQDIRAIAEGVRGEVRKAVVGQDEVIELMLHQPAGRRPHPARGRAGNGEDPDHARLRGRRCGCSSAASSSRPT